MNQQLNVPLSPEQQKQLEQAQGIALQGQPAEVRMTIAVTKPDGRVEHHDLVGRINPKE